MRSPIQAAPVARGSARRREASGVVQSGCDLFKCAGAVAGCLAVCVGAPGSPACIGCLGPAYASCKDCF